VRLIAAFVDSFLLVLPAGLLAIDYSDSADLSRRFIISAIVVSILLIAQAVMLSKSGQTIGKRLLSIRIIGIEGGEIGGFARLVLLRSGVNGLLSIIPLYALLDALLIFREDRRCLHDLIAKTRVIKA